MKIKQFLNFKFYSVIALAFLLNSCASKKKNTLLAKYRHSYSL